MGKRVKVAAGLTALALLAAVVLQVKQLSSFRALARSNANIAANQENPIMLTLIVPYYNQPEELERLLGLWSQYSSPARRRIEFVVVDDGSQKYPASDVVQKVHDAGKLGGIRLLLVTLKEDVGFNHCGACNTGALQARGDVLLFIDADHWLDDDHLNMALAYLKQKLKDPEDRFAESLPRLDGAYAGRVDEVAHLFSHYSGRSRTKEFMEQHMQGSPNTMFITNLFFWEAGGFDEDFAGFYGYEDIAFQRCMKHDFNVTMGVAMGFRKGQGLWAWYQTDGGTAGFSRSVRRNKRLMRDKGARNQYCAKKPKAARVPWEESFSHNWEVTPSRGDALGIWEPPKPSPVVVP